MTGLAPVHVPAWQESVCVQASPSVHEVPSGAAGFEQWRFLATLCQSAWTAGVRRGSPAARRLLRRRLSLLGTQPQSWTTAAALPSGSFVHLRGTARRMCASRDFCSFSPCGRGLGRGV